MTETDEDDGPIGERCMWEALEKMDAAQSLDFACLMTMREVDLPPQLFRSARRIRLVGRMSQGLEQAILHSGPPSRLVALDLDNVYDFGQLDMEKALPDTYRRDQLPEADQRNGMPETRNSGPMMGHLRSLEGKCTSLTRLCLRGVGQDYIGDSLEWYPGLDEQRYGEWASFLGSVKPTLRTLVIEQERRPEDCRPVMCGTIRARVPVQVNRPMDDRFFEFVYPVLKQRSWSHLQSMTIRGVLGRIRAEWSTQGKRTPPGRLIGVAGDQRQSLGGEIQSQFEPEAENTYFHRED